MTHCHRDFTVCSCSSQPVLLPGAPSAAKCSRTAVVSGAPVIRSARPKARRRIAARRHCWLGCSQAPRPGRLPTVSTTTAYSPFPLDTAATRSSSTASSRLRHPTHVRTGPADPIGPGRRCAEAEVSRWITAQSTVSLAGLRNRRGYFPGWPWATSASLRMSIRQPVSRAASRAFCPSLPIASDS